MKKKIISVLALTLIMVISSFAGVFAANEAPVGDDLYIKSAEYNAENREFNLIVANKANFVIEEAIVSLETTDARVKFVPSQSNMAMAQENMVQVLITGLQAGAEKEIIIKGSISGFDKNADMPVIDAFVRYADDMSKIKVGEETKILENSYANIFNAAKASKTDAIANFLKQTGFSITSWKQIVMIAIACFLLYLAIVKQFEPLLLLPIAFGMLLTNLAGAEMFHEELFAEGHVHWNLFAASNYVTPGLIDILYLGVKLGIYPCLIFIGVGAMTDFGPLIANPKSLLLGAAAQVGIFATYLGARALGFTPAEAGSIGIIGGADGPTAIFVTTKLAPHLLGPIAVAAYSYMALVPVIQPPIMKLLTSKKERQIEMKALREVSKTE